MKNKKKCGLLILLQSLFSVLVAGCLSILIVGSSIQIPTMREKTTYLVTPWNVDSTNYEESYIFHDILESNISNAARMAVIRSQMESFGRYNPNKEIDVTAFVHRAGELPEDYITANYYLEDLLKWAKFGFEKNYMLIDEDSFYNKTEQIETDTVVEGDSQDHNVYLEVLKCRYQTVDGKNIEDLVSNEKEYAALCSNIEEAAKGLYHNYEEYLIYQEFFDSANTNFRYCFEMVVDGQNMYFSNIDLRGWNDNRIDGYFRNLGRFLYYHPDDMTYESDTDIEESYLQNVLMSYPYAYPETTKVWMGVDTSYPVSDAYTQTVKIYHNVLPVWWILMGIAVAGILAYLFLLGLIVVRQGHDGEEEGIHLHRIDRIPTEMILLFFFAGVYGVYYAIQGITSLVNNRMIDNQEIIWGVTILTMLVNLYHLPLLYSLVRRVKARILWHGCLLRRIGKVFWSMLKRLAHILGVCILFFADHSSSVMRTLFPCFSIFFVNFIGITFFFKAPEQGIRYGAGCALIIVDVLCVAYVIKTNMDREKIINGIEQICDGNLQYQIDTEQMHGGNLKLAIAVNHIGEGIRSAVEKSIKDERLKADLITNVSHDLKTPLTSIINYVNLIKREQIDNEKVQGYLEILEQKSSRLKTLTEDLVEASKVSSGNVNLIFAKLNIVELLNQTMGEFEEKFEEKGLQIVATYEQPCIYIWADSRRIWRVMENLFGNIYKYAMENTRVYVDVIRSGMNTKEEQVELSIKNISAKPLNIDASQLTERFIRGDVSRTTEGSGLGLSIAKDLTRLQKGDFRIYLDGDLFKVTASFPIYNEASR